MAGWALTTTEGSHAETPSRRWGRLGTYAAAQAAMQQMSPGQLAALRAMVEGMTPEQQAEMIEQAKKLGLV